MKFPCISALLPSAPTSSSRLTVLRDIGSLPSFDIEPNSFVDETTRRISQTAEDIGRLFDFQKLIDIPPVDVSGIMSAAPPGSAEVLATFQTTFSKLNDADYMTLGVTTLVVAAVMNILGGAFRSGGDKSSNGKMNPKDLETPYGTVGRYNADLAAQYFSVRPLTALKRGVEIAAVASSFGLGLFIDYLQGRLSDAKAQEQRADELTDVLTRLGPTFIKVGQSLSIRTDLLRPAYIRGLSKLQDKVPPFPTAVAREIIEKELQAPVDSVFSSGLEPFAKVVAAASLGQVFKATLRADGTEVRNGTEYLHILVFKHCRVLKYAMLYFYFLCSWLLRLQSRFSVPISWSRWR
jgi:ABC1 atypical kinase-like domain